MQLIGIIIVLIILLYLLAAVLWLLIFSFFTLPIWGASVIVMLFTLHVLHVNKIQRLKSSGTLRNIINVRFDGQKLNYDIAESKIDLHANTLIEIFFSLSLGIIVSLIIVNLFYPNRAFISSNDLPKFIPEYIENYFNFIAGSIISIIAMALALTKYKPKKRFKDSIKEKANHLISRITTSLERIEDLCSLENSIKSIASQLQIYFPVDFQTEIQQFVDTHKTEILLSTADLNRLIEKNIKQAKEDKIQLENAIDLYKVLKQEYSKTRSEVIKTGYTILIDQLEYDLKLVNSDNLTSLLTDKKWDDFHNMVNAIIDDFQRLNELAIKYQKDGYDEESYQKEIDNDQMTESKALTILGLKEIATNGKIKEAYLEAVKKYNVDHRQNLEEHILKLVENKFKDINRAYSFLKTRNKRVR